MSVRRTPFYNAAITIGTLELSSKRNKAWIIARLAVCYNTSTMNGSPTCQIKKQTNNLALGIKYE